MVTPWGNKEGEEDHGRMAWIDNIRIQDVDSLTAEESIRMTRDKWRKYVHYVANPRIKDG